MQEKFEIRGETHAIEVKMMNGVTSTAKQQVTQLHLYFQSPSNIATGPSHFSRFTVSLCHSTKLWGLQSFPSAKFRCAFPYDTWARLSKEPTPLISNLSLSSRGKKSGYKVCSG